MKRPTVGIATDGAHSTKERLTRYRAVDLSSGLELFNHSIGNKTNNIGEFLAIIEAVKYILRTHTSSTMQYVSHHVHQMERTEFDSIPVQTDTTCGHIHLSLCSSLLTCIDSFEFFFILFGLEIFT